MRIRRAVASGLCALLAATGLGIGVVIPAMAVEMPQPGGGEIAIGSESVDGSEVGEADAGLPIDESAQDTVLGRLVERAAMEEPGVAAATRADADVTLSNIVTEGINYGTPRMAPATQAPSLVADDGKVLHFSGGAVLVSFELDVHDATKGGDTFTVWVNSDDYTFNAFSGHELKDEESVVIATVQAFSGADSRMVFTFNDNVTALGDVTGFFSASLSPVKELLVVDGKAAGNNNRWNLPVQLFPGAKVAANVVDNHGFANSYNLGGNGGWGNSALPFTRYGPKGELLVGVNVGYQNPGVPLDPASVRVTVKALTEGAVPYCTTSTKSIPLRYVTDDGAVDQFTPSPSVLMNQQCSGNTIVYTFPSGTVLPVTPNGTPVIGFNILSVGFVADTPVKDYTFESSVTANETSWAGPVKSISKSLQLEGHAGGEVLPAKVTTVKDLTSAALPLVGDTVSYKVTVTSTEQYLNAYGIVPTDTLPAGLTFVSASNGGKASGQKITWPAVDIAPAGALSYTVTAEVDAGAKGNLVNKVVVTGENACFEGDTASTCEDDATLTVGAPSATLTKASSVKDTNANGALGDPGDTIFYTFTIKNTGNTAITSAKLTDDLLGLKDYECLAGPLAAGKSTTCIEAKAGDFSHVITEAEGEAGKVVNHATITVPGGPGGPGTTTTPTVKPGLEFEKVVLEVQDTSGTGLGSVETGGVEGDTIVYGFKMTNTGNSTLESIILADELLGIEDHQCLAEGQVLAAGDTAMCVGSFSYVVTAEDAEAGEVLNAATLETPGVPGVPGEVVTPTWTPGFEFEKKVLEVKDTAGKPVTGGKAAEGDVIHYGFTFTNTGNIDLKALTVSDPMLYVEDVDCLAEGEVLPVGESVDCVDNSAYSYVVTAADVKAGKVHNLATGNIPGLPGGEGETTTPVLPPTPVLTLPNTGGNTGLIYLILAAAAAAATGLTFVRARKSKEVDV